MRIYELVSPVARRLSALAEYAFYVARTPGIPLLGEILDPDFPKGPEQFLEFSVLQLGDADVMFEILRARVSDTEDDSDD